MAAIYGIEESGGQKFLVKELVLGETLVERIRRGAITQQGVILGRVAYMPPEQAKGTTRDRRTNIFAFGAVLYEMLTRRQTCPGESVGYIFAAVIRADTDWNRLPPDTPRLAYK